MKSFRWLASFLLISTSCISLSEEELNGPYYVDQDPAASYKTLYYRCMNGSDYERVRNVQKVGYTADYIFVSSTNGLYYIIRAQDQPSDIGNPSVQKAIHGPLTQFQFKVALDSLNFAGFTF
ncbi:hypothetical protein [Hymenobacter sp. BT190]|uniref:hypothetical protein n=1 Tax=Hymenobacter sp. BT190 TaxID=2763505 RepID=UPI001651AB81|nr:hypothetical protein [Hymenobacter sp. BT190]MBC6696772.1 hypothetical protein [Hymenobacter sp. BT190]